MSMFFESVRGKHSCCQYCPTTADDHRLLMSPDHSY